MCESLSYAITCPHTRLTPNGPIITLYEEPHMRYMCPVTWFLSLAFADGVFQDMEFTNELEASRPILGNLFYKAKSKPEVLECSVLMGMLADESMPETIWTYDCFNSALKDMVNGLAIKITSTRIVLGVPLRMLLRASRVREVVERSPHVLR